MFWLYEPTYDAETEKDLLVYSYDLFADSSKYRWTGTKDEFDLDYAFVVFHQHLYFLTKAEGLLQEGGTNPNVQRGRKVFHRQMLKDSYNDLLSHGGDVQNLRPWVESFLQL
jgi:hypothetical protein